MKPSERVVLDLMSRDVLSLREDQDVQHLIETMKLFEFRHLTVTDEGRLVGLITQRDVLRISASSLLPNAREQTEHLSKKWKVRDVMTRGVKTVKPTTTLVEAARILDADKVGCLPVVDDDNALCGIITDSDFLKLTIELLEHPEEHS